MPDFEDLQKNLYDKEKINENQKTNGTTEIANSKYIVNYINIIIQHKHNALEKSFKNYLLSKNINEKNIKQNSHFVDFIFTHRNKKYICELKPSKKEEIKYAIRNSLGQIIEYDYKDNGQYDYKVIVFQKTPTKEILKYLEHIKNKYGIYYLTEVEKNRFEGNLNL